MKNQTPTSAHGVPASFLCKFGREVTAVLSGFDHLRFRATLRLLFVTAKLEAYLSACHGLIKNFKTFAEATTAKIKAAAYASARPARRPRLPENDTRCRHTPQPICREVTCQRHALVPQ